MTCREGRLTNGMHLTGLRAAGDAEAVNKIIEEQKHNRRMTMVKDADKLSMLSLERSNLRSEIVEISRSIRYAIFAFITIAASLASLIFRNDLIGEEGRPAIIIVLSQLEVFFASVSLNLWINQRTHSGYIAAIEEQMNKICGENLNIWESKMVGKFALSPRTGFFISQSLAMAMLLGFLLVPLWAVSTKINWFWTLFVVIEVIVLLVLFIVSYKGQAEAQKYALKIMKEDNEKRKASCPIS